MRKSEAFGTSRHGRPLVWAGTAMLLLLGFVAAVRGPGRGLAFAEGGGLSGDDVASLARENPR